MKAFLTAVLSVGLFPIPAFAERLGDHPAIVVQRLYAQQGYDYESKFYPHPAWLYLVTEPTHTMGDHPAVIVAKRSAQQGCKNEVGEAPAPWTASPFSRISRSPAEKAQ